MRNAEEEALRANIASLGDQLEELSEAQDLDPELEAVDLDPVAILDKLKAGEELSEPEEEALVAFTEGAGELVGEIVGRAIAGEEIPAEDLEILRAAIAGEPGEAEAVAEGERVAKSIIASSLQSVGRADAVPLLSGIAGFNRAGRLVRKRFPDWETARKDTAADPDIARLFGEDDGSVRKDQLPETLELMSKRLGGEWPDEEDDELAGDAVLKRSVRKLAQGEGLTQEEFMELSAANLQGRPISMIADLPVHKEMRTWNRVLPTESLQATWLEVDRLVREATRSSFLKGPSSHGRHGERKNIVRKSLGAAVSMLLGQRT